ncbi:AAA family ATPase [Bacillus sp. OK048]|uniref:AAA family ATPase n=1 Tax=Bacillus sp. OK048 TaxID=1882761 RepID=UPI0008877436|nr:AAA family ATPase [Bacillus sp. OK048]SDM73028.1 AAA domain-containing protein, putative AbiEii toxin, Type IV TA system [Bacillus sp. OK048]
MYLSNIVIQNVGTVGSLYIELPFNNNGNPKPIFFVGENGSGKSILLSHMADSFIEFAKQSFRDIVNSTGNNPNPFFKVTGSINQKTGKQYGLAYLRFKNTDNIPYEYLDKSGNLPLQDAIYITNNFLQGNQLQWNDNNPIKWVTQNSEAITTLFNNNTFCYFPPSRYESPHWLNTGSIKDETLNLTKRFSGILGRDIVVRNALDYNKKWILDVFLDSRADIEEYIENGQIQYRSLSNMDTIRLLRQSKLNIEKILSAIFLRPVILNINLRGDSLSRINILDANSKEIIAPSLDHLSTGQNALLNIFCTIIRYADMVDLNKSIRLEDIRGVVVIDEIDLHLHTILQKEILPKLILMFPKVQFIISTHSPFLLLGMKDALGEDGFTIYEMPKGTQIGVERFSEFNKSFSYYMNTIKFEEELKNEIGKSNKPLVITEGKTDAKMLKVAWEKLYPNEERFFDVIPSGFQLDEEQRTGSAKTVKSTLEYIGNITTRKIIGLFDNDAEGNGQFKGLTNSFETYNVTKEVRKHLNKDVFGLLLPVPESRKIFVTNNDINCRYLVIEHYFSNEVLSRYNMQGNRILGTEVFKIAGNKNSFANIVEELDSSEFENFKLLFENLKMLFSIKIVESEQTIA